MFSSERSRVQGCVLAPGKELVYLAVRKTQILSWPRAIYLYARTGADQREHSPQHYSQVIGEGERKS